LVENPWTWTKAANVIFLESPVGVGFSYADDGNYTTNDNVTADRNFMFVQEWFKKYPEFMTNDFYVAGESYGGIYVPMLSYRVAISDAYNFKGFMTGNPVTDESSDWDPVNVVLPFWYGHGVIPTSLYKAGMMACAGNNSNSPQCNTIMNQAQNYFNGYNMYNIYGDCITQRVVGPVPYPVQNPYLRAARPSELLRVTPPCLDAYAATTYLNRPDVQKAFHVKVGIQWGICSRLPYTNNRGSVLPEYAAVRAMGMDILTYSGDVDSSVPYTGTARWAAAIGGPLLPNTTEWTQWTFNQPDGPQVGGHVTYYESFTYTTVRGSGHMVPQYRPDAAWNMFISWVTTRKLA
jgi:serine carboxypeptidase-like clade 1